MFALVLASTNLASCNTIKGAGRDVSATGDAVSDAARRRRRLSLRDRESPPHLAVIGEVTTPSSVSVSTISAAPTT